MNPKLGYLAILLLCFLDNPTIINAQSNFPGEVGIRNAQIFYYTGNIPFSTSTPDVFLPYIAYLDSTKKPLDYLMDAFILYDQDKSGANGAGHDYNLEKLRTYLYDSFVKARLPQIRNTIHYGDSTLGKAASMEIERGIMQRSINVTPSSFYTLAAYGVIPSANSIITKAGMFAFEVFDANGTEIKGNSNIPGATWSSYLDVWVSYVSLSNVWSRKSITIQVPNNAHSINVQFSRGASSSISIFQNKVYFDYAQFVRGDTSNLLTDLQLESANFATLIKDGSFEKTPMTSPWEAAAGKYARTPLFSDQMSVLDGIKRAKVKAENVIGTPSTLKIILMLPHPEGLSIGNIVSYNAKLRAYIQECELFFDNWKTQNPGYDIELMGWYFSDESLKQSKPEIHSFLSYSKNLISSKGFKLFSSPYNTSSTPIISSSCLQEYWKYFDAIWMQPNCWFNPGGSLGNATNIDLDMLRLVGDYVFQNNLAINIETKGNLMDSWSQESNLGYDRFLDYAAYGYFTGYVNLSKCYYDAGGQHWLSAFSSNKIEREQYDELSRFISSSKVGYIPNGNFEQKTNNNRFMYWDGAYNTIDRSNNQFQFGQFFIGLSRNQAASTKNRILINHKYTYAIEVNAREEGDDGKTNSALVGVELFDENGLEIKSGVSGFIWSSFLDMWYKYVPVQDQWKVYQVSFIPPLNSTSAKVHLYNWYCDNQILIDNIKLLTNNQDPTPKSRWNTNTPLYLYENNKPAFTPDLINVNGSDKVDIKVMVRESKNDGKVNSALFRIDAFDDQFNLITPSIGSINGMSWSTRYNFWYKYIGIESIHSSTSPWYESNWIDWHRVFDLPPQTKWIRCYFHRWTLDPANVIAFHRPILNLKNLTSVEHEKNIDELTAYPNPFESSIKFKYSLSKKSHVKITIYDIFGNAILELKNEQQQPGSKIVIWDGLTQKGNQISSGIYICQIQAGEIIQNMKVIKY